VSKNTKLPTSTALGDPRAKMRFFLEEDEEMKQVAEAIGQITGDSIVDLIRRSVRKGWPLVKRELQPLLDNAKTTS